MHVACYDHAAVKRPQGKTDIQVRGVPVTLRDRARERAKSRGHSLSEYIRGLIDADLAQPTIDEWIARIKARPPVRVAPMGGMTIVDVMHEARREAGWED